MKSNYIGVLAVVGGLLVISNAAKAEGTIVDVAAIETPAVVQVSESESGETKDVADSEATIVTTTETTEDGTTVQTLSMVLNDASEAEPELAYQSGIAPALSGTSEIFPNQRQLGQAALTNTNNSNSGSGSNIIYAGMENRPKDTLLGALRRLLQSYVPPVEVAGLY